MLPYTSPDAADVAVAHIMSGGCGCTSSCSFTITCSLAIARTTI